VLLQLVRPRTSRISCDPSTFGELLAFAHEVALEHDDVLAIGMRCSSSVPVWVFDEMHAAATLAPKSMMPSIFAISRRLSTARFDNSATPAGPRDVFVFEVLRGVLAIKVPARSVALVDHDVRAGRNRVVRDGFAPVIDMTICGCNPPCAR